MSNTYTEREMMLAAMISNCRITDGVLDWTRDKFLLADDEAPTFEQIVIACEEKNYDLWFREHKEGEVNNEAKFFEWAKTEDYGNWKIVGIYDDNDNSGFYAVAIETGEYTTNHVENGVIFSVRGTEPTTNEQKYLDIVNTDLMIINSDVTAQELVMYDYLDNEFATLLEQKGYSNLATTGHSLGGYLAFSAAAHIATDEESYAYEIFMQGTNIDGPGVTEENLEVNKDVYAKLDPYLTHYHYTYVGSILTPICSKYISITGASDPSDYLEDMPEEYYEWMINHFGPEMTEHINTLFRYYNAHTGKHSLASLQFVNDEDFDTSYVENHNYIEVSDMELSPYSFDGLVGVIFETIVVLIVNQLYNESMNYDDSVEFDLWAGIVNKATELVDDNDQLQIFSGGILDAVTIFMNEFYLTDEYAEFSEPFGEFVDTYREMVVHFVNIMSDPSIDVEQWFALVDDVMVLAEDFDYEEMASDGKAVAEQFIDTIGHVSCNIMSMRLTMAENCLMNI